MSLAGPVAAVTLTNVSYDPTREFYEAYNAAFAAHWKAETGEDIAIRASHGGSGKQARAVIDGLPADVVTLALESDINAIVEKTGKIPADWRGKLPHNSAPYTSTIVFLVRKGNPKGIHDWGDLVKDGIEVITPNPKTSGGARWNYLAAWAWAAGQYGGDEAKIRDFVATLYKARAGARYRLLAARPSLSPSANSATCCSPGRTRLSWRSTNSVPTSSISWCRRSRSWPSRRSPSSKSNAKANGTEKEARAYLEYLYSAEGQTLAAKFHYRPAEPKLVDPALLKSIPQLKLVSIDDPLFGGWAKAQPYHFG